MATHSRTRSSIHTYTGKFWEPSAIHKLVAPAKADVQLVQEWLSFRYRIKKEHQQLTLSRDFLVVNVTVAQAEKMLHTSFHTFQHTSGQKFYRALESYSLPFMVRGTACSLSHIHTRNG